MNNRKLLGVRITRCAS